MNSEKTATIKRDDNGNVIGYDLGFIPVTAYMPNNPKVGDIIILDGEEYILKEEIV